MEKELVALLLRAGKEEVRITLNSKAEATRLRFRLHNIRRFLRKKKMLPEVEKASLHVEENILVARPKDANFVDAIRKAGISSQDVPELPIEEITKGIEREGLSQFDAMNRYLKIDEE